MHRNRNESFFINNAYSCAMGIVGGFCGIGRMSNRGAEEQSQKETQQEQEPHFF
jgi:hypothetical protein